LVIEAPSNGSVTGVDEADGRALAFFGAVSGACSDVVSCANVKAVSVNVSTKNAAKRQTKITFTISFINLVPQGESYTISRLLISSVSVTLWPLFASLIFTEQRGRLEKSDLRYERYCL
jgi:hypothetical protein